MNQAPAENPFHPKRKKPNRALICALTAVLAVALYAALPPEFGELPRRTLAIFLVAAVLWSTEALPLFATSFCVLGLEILLLANRGGLAGVGNLRSEQFFLPFSSSIIILFMGGFLLSHAVTKHGIDRAIAARLLRPFSRSPILMVYGVLGITALFSMWMSNTAAAVMMIAVLSPVVAPLGDDNRFATSLILAVPFGAAVGGIGTPIGTPPNAVALAALRQAGYDVGFLDWMLLAVPLVVLLLVLIGLLLFYFFPPQGSMTLVRLDPPAEISWQGKLTLVILAATVALWLTGDWHGISVAGVALLAAALLTALGVLDRHDVNSIDWDILVLMWGGLSLGQAMQLSGLLDWVVRLPLSQMSGIALSGIVVLLALGLSTFMSNTATANLVIPMAMAFSLTEQGQLAILAALACSFAMAMPVSTPPNAIAYATGKVPVADMIWVGGLISIVSVVVMLLGYQAILPWVLGF